MYFSRWGLELKDGKIMACLGSTWFQTPKDISLALPFYKTFWVWRSNIHPSDNKHCINDHISSGRFTWLEKVWIYIGGY